MIGYYIAWTLIGCIFLTFGLIHIRGFWLDHLEQDYRKKIQSVLELSHSRITYLNSFFSKQLSAQELIAKIDQINKTLVADKEILLTHQYRKYGKHGNKHFRNYLSDVLTRAIPDITHSDVKTDSENFLRQISEWIHKNYDRTNLDFIQETIYLNDYITSLVKTYKGFHAKQYMPAAVAFYELTETVPTQVQMLYLNYSYEPFDSKALLADLEKAKLHQKLIDELPPKAKAKVNKI